ncbi:MAG TPA: ABC transporter permease [Thermomicrobiaceae bacterium]|nr:ABC transporter permease [Thermomicrobiaceae bacterium]
MGRTAYILHRLIQMIPTIVILAILIFLMIRAIPGNPAVTVLGIQATPQAVAQMSRQMGLDKPLPVQFAIYVGQILHGDLGRSTLMQVPVVTLVRQRLPLTLALVVYAMILSLLITIPLAIVAALKKDRLADQIVRVYSIAGISTPAFWIGILLLILLGVKVRLFPVGGIGTSPLQDLRYLFLPALTLALGISAVLIRNLRDAILTTMSAEHVMVARAKGLRGRVVLLRHVLRNALISTVTLIGLYLGWLVGGSVIIEDVFGLPGMGSMMISSILARDYAVVQGFTLVYAVLVLVIYLLTDIAYSVVDPRITL